MSEKKTSTDKLNPDSRLEVKITKILEERGALPVCAIEVILEEESDKKINRRRLYRKLNKMRYWNQLKKATARKVSYFKLKE